MTSRNALFSLITASLLLAGCSNGFNLGLGIGGFGSHVGGGASVSIPIGTTTTTRGGVNFIEEPIIAFFSSDTSGNQIANQPQKGGYYRQLLRRQGSLYLVQDFYEDSATKRTDPMLLKQNQLMQFQARPDDGSYRLYSPSGQLLLQP